MNNQTNTTTTPKKRGRKPLSPELRRERYLASHTRYNDANKAKRNVYSNVKITCGCGSVISRGNKTKHLLTEKHKRITRGLDELIVI